MNYINQEALIKVLRLEMNQHLTEAAEPFVQQAIKSFEKEIRRKLAEMLISKIEQSVEMYGSKDRLTISILQGPRD